MIESFAGILLLLVWLDFQDTEPVRHASERSVDRLIQRPVHSPIHEADAGLSHPAGQQYALEVSDPRGERRFWLQTQCLCLEGDRVRTDDQKLVSARSQSNEDGEIVFAHGTDKNELRTSREQARWKIVQPVKHYAISRAGSGQCL